MLGAPPAGGAARTALDDFEVDVAQAGTPDFDTYFIGCVDYTGVEACFQPYGDVLWVKDTGGSAATAAWGNDLWTGSAWKRYRTGECDNHLGVGHWGYCTKEFYEDSSVSYHGGTGSGLWLWAQTDFGYSEGEWNYSTGSRISAGVSHAMIYHAACSVAAIRAGWEDSWAVRNRRRHGRRCSRRRGRWQQGRSASPPRRC